jgi:hypothetical protein
LAQTHANPTSRMDSIVVQSGRCRSHLKAPRSKAESEGEVREEGNAAVEISRKSEEEKEEGELELRRAEVDQGEDRAKPSELSSGIEVGAIAVEASYARITINGPVQGWVQRSGVEDRGCTKEGQMPRELGKGIRNKEGIGERSAG